jgi:serine protease Do
MNRSTIFLTSLLAFVLAGQPALVRAEPKPDRNTDDSIRTNGPRVLGAFRDVVAGPSQSVVQVLSKGKKAALGTIVAADGYIITKASEVSTPISCQLRDGNTLDAKIVGIHEPYDLVLLKVEAKDLKPIRWADPKTALVGNWVATPGPSSDPVAVGVISVAARKVTSRDLPPIRNDSGFLGILLENAEGSVRILAVEPKSPAEKAGLKSGDTVTTISGKVVATSDALVEIVQRFKAGEEVTLHIKRGDEELKLKCVLGKRPFDRAAEQNSMGNENSIRRGGFPTILQHDTVLKPVDCGGPLVDLDGQAVGINIARGGRTETYAVPVNDLLPVLAELKSLASLGLEFEKSKAHLQEAVKTVQDLRTKNQPTDLMKAEADVKVAMKKVQELRAKLEKIELETRDK